MQSAILAFFFFFLSPSFLLPLVPEMILLSGKTASCLRFPRSCRRGWLEFQCYKNGAEPRGSGSVSGLQV